MEITIGSANGDQQREHGPLLHKAVVHRSLLSVAGQKKTTNIICMMRGEKSPCDWKNPHSFRSVHLP